MYEKMQVSGLTEIIPFKCISAIWGLYPVFSLPECDDPRMKEEIKPRRVLECRKRKMRPLSSFPLPCCSY